LAYPACPLGLPLGAGDTFPSPRNRRSQLVRESHLVSAFWVLRLRMNAGKKFFFFVCGARRNVGPTTELPALTRRKTHRRGVMPTVSPCAFHNFGVLPRGCERPSFFAEGGGIESWSCRPETTSHHFWSSEVIPQQAGWFLCGYFLHVTCRERLRKNHARSLRFGPHSAARKKEHNRNSDKSCLTSVSALPDGPSDKAEQKH